MMSNRSCQSGYPIGLDDASISLPRILAVTPGDWGWWRTVTTNLARLSEFCASDLQAGELDLGDASAFDPSDQASRLMAELAIAPKSTRWGRLIGLGN